MIDDLLVPLEYRLELLQGFPPQLSRACADCTIFLDFQSRSSLYAPKPMSWIFSNPSIPVSDRDILPGLLTEFLFCDDSLNCDWNIILRKWTSWMRVQLQFANKGLKGELWSIQKSTRIYVLTRLSSRAMPATANVTPGFYLLEWGVASECPSTTAQAALSDQQWGRKATHRYRWAPNWPRQST